MLHYADNFILIVVLLFLVLYGKEKDLFRQ